MAVLAENRKANFDYEIIETFEAGVELLGLEVKSLKLKRGSLEGAYILVDGGEAFVMNMSIPAYQENNTSADYDPRRKRKILLTSEEIHKLTSGEHGQGLTSVPISVYTKGNRVKLTIAIVRGKKKYDKRETIKRREADREMGREMRDR